MRVSDSKIKVGWIAPCIGVGGADAFMLSLIKNTPNLKHTGIAIGAETNYRQLEWARRVTGDLVPFYQLDHGNTQYEGINYSPIFSNVVHKACCDADIIITWCMPDIQKHTLAFNKPTVELVQNCDKYAEQILQTNTPDFTVAVSNTVAKICKEPDAIIYNAVDPNRCTPKWGRQTTRTMCDFRETDKIMLFAGRLVEEKWPEALYDVLPYLDENWVVMFVGDGYAKPTMIQEIQRRHLDKRVFFVEPQFDLGDVLAAADVFVLPSDFEGLPLAMIEAWLAGVPVVTTDMDVMVEFRTHYGELATYVPRRCTPRILADAIEQASKHDPIIVSNARQLAWERLTIGTVALQWERFLNGALMRWRDRQTYIRINAVKPIEVMDSSKAHVRIVELQ